MQNKIPILDAGHGGMYAGKYQTKGKRSPNWKLGVLYEGAFNRWIVALIMRELDYAGVPYYHISSELRDVTLGTRVKRANKIFAEDPNAYLLSIHANAGGGTGMEGYTFHGQNQSDEIAEEILGNLKTEFEPQGWKMRSDTADGDLDKESAFRVLKETLCPAVLLECGFMDHVWDYEKLWDYDFQQSLACNISKSIIRLYENHTELV